jgi:hypothetical protein
VGFEPTNPCGIAASGYNGINWISFKDFLQKQYRPITVRCRYDYALKYHKLLLDQDLSPLNLVTDIMRVHILKALSALSKFLGVNDSFKFLMQKYGLKWSINNKDDLIIQRMLKPLNSGSVVEWIRQVYAKIPKAKPYVDLLLCSGMRPLEGMDSHNLIIKLDSENRLMDYYDSDRQVLQHFRYRSIFIRRSKKVYISFVPNEIPDGILTDEPIVPRTLYKNFERTPLPIRFCDIREYWSTQMSKFLSRIEIDFLQGRWGTVYMQNYFNPTYIEDLQNRTMQGIKTIMQSIQNNPTKNN